MNNNDFKVGQHINVDLGYNKPTLCEVMAKVKGGYTKLIVKDIESDTVATITSPNSDGEGEVWQKVTKRNLSRGMELEIHVKQIISDE